MSMHVGYTISKKDSKRYIHLVWYEPNSNKTKEVSYARSDDYGKTWTKRTVLVKNYSGEAIPTTVIDTNSVEG